MLRIGTPPAAPPPQDPETTPPAVDVAPVDDPKDSSSKFDAEKVNPVMVHYMTADQGPFECQRCSHWEAPNACILVSGEIDPAGVCNLFESSGDDMGPEPDSEGPTEGIDDQSEATPA